MESLGQLLEEELTLAFEVKDPKRLHRYVLLLSENMARKSEQDELNRSLKSDIKELIAFSQERFDAIDRRFEEVNKRFEDNQRSIDRRFEDMNRRFTMLQWFMGVGLTLIAGLVSLFQVI